MFPLRRSAEGEDPWTRLVKPRTAGVAARHVVVAALMGHAKVDTALNVYTQVIAGALRTAVAKVGDELFTIVQ